jgi:hypothetical protein
MDMKPSGSRKSRVIGILMKQEAGAKTVDLCRNTVSSTTLYGMEGDVLGLELSVRSDWIRILQAQRR